MDYKVYRDMVVGRYDNVSTGEIGDYQADVMYEEEFKWRWIATKLKMFSFINYSEHVSRETVESYSKLCFKYAIKNYKGLPRGCQCGVAFFPVIASENIDEDAVSFVRTRPKKHFSAFGMPAIYDLKKEELYYYAETPIWGSIYYKYLRGYVEKNFR